MGNAVAAPRKLKELPPLIITRVGTGSIPEAKAGAKGVTGLVVLKQGLAVAGKVLHLN